MNREELIVYVGILLSTGSETASLVKTLEISLGEKSKRVQALSEALHATRSVNAKLLGDLEDAYLIIQRLKRMC